MCSIFQIPEAETAPAVSAMLQDVLPILSPICQFAAQRPQALVHLGTDVYTEEESPRSILQA
jgi:hypothetical protein